MPSSSPKDASSRQQSVLTNWAEAYGVVQVDMQQYDLIVGAQSNTHWLDHVQGANPLLDDELTSMLSGMSGRTVPGHYETDAAVESGSPPTKDYLLEPHVWPPSVNSFPKLTGIPLNLTGAATFPVRRQSRSIDDLYSPVEVRGKGHIKEGRCPICPTPQWYKIKQSAYWYHMNFTHGISATTGRPFPMPGQYRRQKTIYTDDPSSNPTMMVDGQCANCHEWVNICTREWNGRTCGEAFDSYNHSPWYKHVQRCYYCIGVAKRPRPQTK